MPYTIKKDGGARPYKIIKKSTGKQVGSSRTKAEAESSARARMGAEHGWKPTGKKGKRS